MFDLLKTLSRGDAVRAVYEAQLRLSQRERLAWIKESATFPVTDDPLAAELLAEIERQEGKHLADLSRPETEQYILALSSALEGVPRDGPPVDPRRARELLDELRRDYSGPHFGRRYAASHPFSAIPE